MDGSATSRGHWSQNVSAENTGLLTTPSLSEDVRDPVSEDEILICRVNGPFQPHVVTKISDDVAHFCPTLMIRWSVGPRDTGRVHGDLRVVADARRHHRSGHRRRGGRFRACCRVGPPAHGVVSSRG
uniref:RdRp n=1 Tax=Fowleria viaulae hepevirus TaxID=3156504 RepID=A0AAU7BB78_9VIRU